MRSALLAVFPEEQLKELREAEVTVLLVDVGKTEVLLKLTNIRIKRYC